MRLIGSIVNGKPGNLSRLRRSLFSHEIGLDPRYPKSCRKLAQHLTLTMGLRTWYMTWHSMISQSNVIYPKSHIWNIRRSHVCLDPAAVESDEEKAGFYGTLWTYFRLTTAQCRNA